MTVVVLDTQDMHAHGVLPYKTQAPLNPDLVFLFKDIKHTMVSGVGLKQPLKVYALTRDLKPISVRRWPWVEGFLSRDPKEIMHTLSPEMQAMLPYNAAHMVETSDATPTIKDFRFLKRYV